MCVPHIEYKNTFDMVMLMTLEQRIARLEFKEDARDVLSMYCRALDTANEKLLISILHPDVELQRPDDELVIGRDAVFEFFRQALADRVEFRRHFVTNPEVTVTSDSVACAESYFFALHHDKGQLSFAWGGYQLEVIRDNDGIFIKKLVIDLDMPISPLRSMLGGD